MRQKGASTEDAKNGVADGSENGEHAQESSPTPSDKDKATSKLPEAWNQLFKLTDLDRFDEDLFTKALTCLLEATAERHQVRDSYNLLVLYDESTLLRSDADRIYRALSEFPDAKPILLVLYSLGGSIEAGFLISKLCREFCKGKFIVAVPRVAKSAATLICCGADEVHMGGLSELGPIDPQIRSLPALGLKNSVQHIAELTTQYPAASSMFADYLNQSLELIHLGYYERVAESAAQYAERLLKKRNTQLPDPGSIAKHLVYAYKDHGFVIDDQEAEQIFGAGYVMRNTAEYKFANDLYTPLSVARRIASMRGYEYYLTGTLGSKPELLQKRDKADP